MDVDFIVQELKLGFGAWRKDLLKGAGMPGTGREIPNQA